MRLSYFKGLDGLRAIAAFMVICAHFFNAKDFAGHPIIVKAATFGNSGVSLFFVLSGFVITRILMASVESNSYFKAFYARRILRIFPLYYFSLLCYYYLPYLAANFNVHIGPQYTLGFEQIYHFTYIQNFAKTFNWDFSGPSHFWSLAVEEHFYLIWPAVVYFVHSVSMKKFLYVTYAMIIIPIIIRLCMLSNNYNTDYFTLTRVDQLAMGSLLAIFERRGSLNINHKKFYYTTLIAGITLFIACSFFSDVYKDTFKHTALGAVYFAIIALVIIFSSHSKNPFKFLNSGVIQYLGTISYGIYIWHLIAIVTIVKYYKTPWVILDFILGIAVTIVVASISYYVLEKPFLKLKRFFPYQ